MPGENLTREEARTRAGLVQVEHYEVDLDLTTGPETFRSTTTARFTATPGASTFIDLISAAVHEVVLNGTALDVAAVNDGVRIQLDDLAAENELLVVADCRYMNTGEGLHRFVDPVDDEVYLYSQFEVADSRRVYAVFEQPDLKAEFTFTVTAPAHWRVISNSPVEHRHPVEAGTRWTFERTPRLSSYVTAVIAGPTRARRTPSCRPTAGRSRWGSTAASRSCSTSTPTTSCAPRSRVSSSSSASSTAPTRSRSTTRSSCRSSTRARWRTRAR